MLEIPVYIYGTIYMLIIFVVHCVVEGHIVHADANSTLIFTVYSGLCAPVTVKKTRYWPRKFHQIILRISKVRF